MRLLQCRGLIKFTIVYEHAAATCRRLRDLDDVKVHLYSEAQLRENLDLSTATYDMLFGSLADVTDEELEAAANAALIAAQPGSTTRIAFFEIWDPRQKHLRVQSASHYSYDNLPLIKATCDQDTGPLCAIAQQALGELSQPVATGQDPHWHVYESSEFMRWWQETATDPAFRKLVSPKDLWRYNPGVKP